MIEDLAQDIADLNELWNPLAWQIPFGRALFYEGVKDLGAQCGRSSGKTELMAYCAWRWARENPGSENYIIEPLFIQAKEILWASGRIQSFGPESWIRSVNNTECRITFDNGSFIKLEGSENTEKLRGIKPRGLVCYDETKDHKAASIEAMDPNRARYNVPALYLGTPPEFHNHFVDIMSRLKSDPSSFWCTADSFANHYNNRDFLEKKRRTLIEQGNEEQWQREYLALFVKGGKGHIFPQFVKYKPKPRESLLPLDIHRWHLVTWFDPGSTSTFAALFALYNPYSKKLHLVDEIYETDMTRMTSRIIHEQAAKIVEKYKKLGVQNFTFGYDEAAAWFRNEMNELAPTWWLEPTTKASHSKEDGISLIRDMITDGMLEVSEECVKMIWEFEGYIKDENGRIPKINDHLLDCLRYILGNLGYEFKKRDVPKEKQIQELRRGYAMQDENNTGWREIDAQENFEDGSYTELEIF